MQGDRKKIIHINKNIIQYNLKHGTRLPVCRVEYDNEKRYCMEVKINGPSRMIYSPDKPLKCGARLWIETYSIVDLIGEQDYQEIKNIMEKKGLD